MIALVQRVSEASVTIDAAVTGQIGRGILAFVCAEREDTEADAVALAGRVLGYRIFPDAQGRMNRSLTDIDGGLLAVPQFTLAADTHSGTRPSFTPAAPPALGERLFGEFVRVASARHRRVAAGVFGAHMQVELINDGPVTFWLQTRRPGGRTITRSRGVDDEAEK
jgi:D-tyrosyl-tRNA(Tyr) deacylase